MRSAALPVGRGAAQGGAGAGPGLGSNPEPPPPRTRLCLARAPPRFLGGPVVSLLSCSVSFAASSPVEGRPGHSARCGKHSTTAFGRTATVW